MTREHNWADNHTFKCLRIHRPSSIDEVCKLVAASSRIRAIGARHSFNGIADSPGDLLDLGGLDPDLAIDQERRTVTVGAQTRYGVLANELQNRGWALHNLASLSHISVAGAVATGTHGSGDDHGNLATWNSSRQPAIASWSAAAIRASTAWWSGSARSASSFA
jgi:alditol oxidase